MMPPYEPTESNRVKINILGEAQNWRCAYCGIRCDGEANAHNAASRDHVIPKCVGGFGVYEHNRWQNEIMACRLCNSHRGAMFARAYHQFVKWKGREKAARYASRRHSRRAKRDAREQPQHTAT